VVGRLEGKIALVTGAARGQGRSHAVHLAREGAGIIAIDVCHGFDAVPFKGSTSEDLRETVRRVEAEGAPVVAHEADVRDLETLQRVVDAGVADLGGLDVVVANAAIGGGGMPAIDIDPADWNLMIDVNLTGTWNTTKVTVPHLQAAGRGGSMILISSAAGLQALPGVAHYTAAKHGVIGLMRTLANELAHDMIRVNSICPGFVGTPMTLNDFAFKMFRPDLDAPTEVDAIEGFKAMQPMPIPYVDPVDVSNAVLFLASDEARYITGVALPVDAGLLAKV
jgi:SDR family mycofactocin-dependent oxidoreductase